ncbi:MoxR family ATPase [Anabaena cylindrica FACHB-243]|nr:MULTISPECIES: MoxR family ATPase [Anabaena]MBD2418233.1 MoxR family ATPase [Anabaena cylindrica FACHB-243]MBY5285222.1 MoxR family ATPase [Anabaena sp. CCAP 1446/1C]MBY5311215.1 MoxR family ATPase [Anabaena sp. CCAP 1446/1C]MCM2409302.1 MoxR family ATPase [Anabaena sp. CCAP 1446/1C]
MTYQFENNPQKRPSAPHPDSPTKAEPYIAPDDLIDAVNLAIFLRRPLLLEGEVGCGKTRLAIAIAYELGLPFYRWDIRSTTKAQEGLYEYDAILRLHDVQTQKLDTSNQNQVKENNQRNPSNPQDYRTFGAIGKAFISKKPAVVLIDEIDKADIDFPNDLLTVLDEPWEFKIRETGETIKANPDYQPIVIITSNKEKGNLPAPFLRRCIYYYVKFPSDPGELQKIVDLHYQYKQKQETEKKLNPSNELVQAAAKLFLKIREDKGLFKIPGTSEFLDWIDALYRCQSKQNPQPPYPADELEGGKLIPYRELIFKIRQDWQKNTSFSQSSLE